MNQSSMPEDITESPPTSDRIPIPASQVEMFQMFQELMRDTEKRKKLVDLIAGERPRQWKTSTNSPYYKARYALELKQILDAMIEKRDDMEYTYADFPNMSKTSLYLRVNQAKKFLIVELDPDKKYYDFLNIVAITREKTGVRLSIPDDLREPGSIYQGRVVSPKSENNVWKDELDAWLETSLPGQVFLKKKLSLSEDDIKTLEASLMPLKDVIYSITYNTIKVVKTEVSE